MHQSTEITTKTLENYQEYLSILARGRIGSQLRSRVAASDIVQETLLDAHRKRGQFRGTTQAEVAAWLRRILASRLADAFRAEKCDKRDVSRRRFLNETLEDSHTRLENCLAAVESTPSDKAARNEQTVRLARALAELPSGQREAVEMRYLEGMSINETAGELDKTPASVAGLLRRGLRRLRESLAATDTG
jgi:RNA polymerase sigma-70 factor (ECF subfamily)